MMLLVTPAREHLSSFLEALRRGYNDSHIPLEERLPRIERDPDAFLKQNDDPHAQGGDIRLPDGSLVSRLPSITRWMWDGEFCGSISLRWSTGTADLPPYYLGHIGYSVVEWKRQRGYATSALAQILPHAREIHLPYVEVVTNLDNVFSQQVILKNGGALIEEFEKPPSTGGGRALRFRIAL
jgi:predicted acetyltransferase